MKAKKNIVVIGGGFAGLNFARHIDGGLFNVLLIDRVNHHQFQPLFYQVATSQLEPSSISFPFRKIFQKDPHVDFRLAEVQAVRPAENRVETSAGSFPYDHLVIACGCTTNFFGNTALMKNALSLKTTIDAIRIRNHILVNFERIYSAPADEKEALMNIVIVGGGPTGVELAGSFAELKKNILPKDYHGVDFTKLNIYLVEGSNKTLGTMSPVAQQASRHYLEKMGVSLISEVFVKNYDGERAELSSGRSIRTKNFIWTAGVIGNVLQGLDPGVIVKGNRIRVDRFNRVTGYANIFALGDIALMQTPKYPNGHPQLANPAINQARNLARNFSRKEKGKPLREWEYRDLGSMATIGKNKAVVDLPFWKFKGYAAWLVWTFLHLMLILSVRKKLIIFINWAWNYVTKDTSLRLILSQK